jgi:hypothetical protein
MANRIVVVGLVSVLASTPFVLAQTEQESFGVFYAQCNTAKTKVRTCRLLIHNLEYFNQDHLFVVSIDPDSLLIGGQDATRLRVDNGRILTGRRSSSTDLYEFSDKKENERFLKEMEKGKQLSVEVGGKFLSFDLEYYRKALAAYNKLKGSPTSRHPGRSKVPRPERYRSL